MKNDPDVKPAARQASPWLLAVTLFLIGMNLRPALTGVAPVLSAIRSDTGLTAAGAGVLTTLPVLCFGMIAPLGTLLARRYAAERIILSGLLLLAAGITLRAFFGMTGLFSGTFLTGTSIGIVMVLLPGIIKRDFASNTGFITGLYSMALCFGAAVAAGIAVPIQHLAGDDWRPALAFWSLPALVAAIAWGCTAPNGAAHIRQTRYHVTGLRSSGLAWQVAAFMGLQSFLAYCVFGWLPSILIDRGLAPFDAGAVLSISIAAQLATALAGPWLATRGRDQRAAAVILMAMTLVGLLGCMYAPTVQIWPWAIVLGLGQGGSFSVAMMLVVLRSPNTQVVAALSGMTQAVGYVLAALGPFVAGLVRDLTGGWDIVALGFLVIGIASMAAGLGAGRRLYVKAEVVESDKT